MTTARESIGTDNRIAAPANAIANVNVNEDRVEHRSRLAQAGSQPTAQIISLPDLQAGADDAASPRGGMPVLQDSNPLHHIQARLQVCVGEATLSVGELLGAQAGQVLRLDRGIGGPVDLTVEGRVIARGQLVAVDGHFAVRLTELPITLNLIPGS